MSEKIYVKKIIVFTTIQHGFWLLSLYLHLRLLQATRVHKMKQTLLQGKHLFKFNSMNLKKPFND
jgi:hypothetical protein